LSVKIEANTLSLEHAAMLQASAVHDDVAEARGYRTVTTKAELRRLGFTDAQCLAPTVLLPIWNAHGEVALYHHRPDTPRMRDGKAAKYEFSARAKMAVDVHPFLREKVRDPSVPLLITEGVKKADAAVSAGLCCIALAGVWNWRGTNEWGGKTSLPDWDAIALKGQNDAPRQVYLVFDSDVMLNPSVHGSLSRLSEFLKQRGANVAFVYLPHGADGAKMGLDDFLASGHTPADVLNLATSTLRPLPVGDTEPELELPYRETSHGLMHLKPTPSGPVPVPLSNFTARIVEDVVEDDGAASAHFFCMEARRGKRTVRFRVAAGGFGMMNWPAEHLGAGAFLFPGQGTKDHARAAIQMLSGDPPMQRVYSHTGWREVEDGRWAFLHGSGAVGASDTVQVSLSPALSRFALPPAPDGNELIHAVRVCLRLWSLLPDAVGVPLWCGVWRSVLGTCDFALHIAGPSGAFKSEVAALAQQHFGSGLDARHLPGAWSSTDNALEGLAFTLKDAMCVIDDFAPIGTAQDVARLHAKADRVLRGQGNGAGRGRMNADGSLRVVRFPRGLIISTGEDVPAGLSLRARLLVLEIAPGMVDADKLTACQQDAATGLYAQCLSGFLAWLAPQLADVQTGLRARTAELRGRASGSGQHRRTPDIVAHLAAGLDTWLHFAEQVGAITDKEREGLWRRGWQALGQAAGAQAAHQGVSEPTRRYLELLGAALASGRAHVAGPDGNAPDDAQAWGWRFVTVGMGDNERTEWRPQGERIGWQDVDGLFLEPDAAHAVAKRLGENGGDGLALNVKTLHKRLHERGLLLSTEAGRGNTVRRTLEGRRREVLHLHPESLNAGAEDGAARANAEPSPVAETAHSAQTDYATALDSGQNGQFGQIMETHEREVWRP